MQQILSVQAKEGMVLAQDIILPDGRILCGKGTIFSQTLINRLLRMDISNVTVEGHPFEVEGEKTLAEELCDLDERFSLVGKIPPLVYIKKRLRQRLIDSRS